MTQPRLSRWSGTALHDRSFARCGTRKDTGMINFYPSLSTSRNRCRHMERASIRRHPAIVGSGLNHPLRHISVAAASYSGPSALVPIE